MLTVCWKLKARQQEGSEVGHRRESCQLVSLKVRWFVNVTCDGMAGIWSTPCSYIFAMPSSPTPHGQRNVPLLLALSFNLCPPTVDYRCWISLIKPSLLCSWSILEEHTVLGWCSLFLQEHPRPPVMRAHSGVSFFFCQGASAIFPTLSSTRGGPYQEVDAWESWFSPSQGTGCSGGCPCHRPTHQRCVGIWRAPHYEVSLACQRHHRDISDSAYNELLVWLFAGFFTRWWSWAVSILRASFSLVHLQLNILEIVRLRGALTYFLELSGSDDALIRFWNKKVLNIHMFFSQ